MSEPAEDRPALLTVFEVATMCAVSTRTVNRLITSGELPAVNLGLGKNPEYRVDIADVRTMLRERAVRRS